PRIDRSRTYQRMLAHLLARMRRPADASPDSEHADARESREPEHVRHRRERIVDVRVDADSLLHGSRHAARQERIPRARLERFEQPLRARVSIAVERVTEPGEALAGLGLLADSAERLAGEQRLELPLGACRRAAVERSFEGGERGDHAFVEIRTGGY